MQSFPASGSPHPTKSAFIVPENIEEVLTTYYQSVNPEKVNSVKSILESYKGEEDQLYQRLVNKYGKEPWPLQSPSTPSVLGDLPNRLQSLRESVYSALTDFVNSQSAELPPCAHCASLQAQLRDRNAQLSALKQSLARSKLAHLHTSLPSPLLEDPADDPSDSVSIISEAVPAGESLLEPFSHGSFVAEQLAEAVRALSPLCETPASLEAFLCSLAVEDLEFLRSVAAEGVRTKPWKRDGESGACTLCGKTFGSFYRRHHCRLCGEVFCNKCCGTTLSVRSLGENKRFCCKCYSLLCRINEFNKRNTGKN